MKYFSIGYAEAKALQDVEALRDIMYHFMDDHIQARVEKKLQDAKTLPEFLLDSRVISICSDPHFSIQFALYRASNPL